MGEGLTRILVIDNGAIAIDEKDRLYVNSHTGEFVSELADAGLEPKLMAPLVTHSRDIRLSGYCLQDHQISSVQLNTHWKYSAFLALFVLAREIISHDFIYIFFPGTLGKIAALLCQGLRRPYGLYVRGCQFSDRGFDKRVLKRAHFALSVSPLIEANLRNYCRRVTTIRPMLDISVSDQLDRVPIDTTPSRWKLLFVGNLTTDKGVRELIAAAQMLTRKGFPFDLKMVGGGVLHDELKEALLKDKYNNNIKLTGLIIDREALLQEYEEADILILPTYHEGFPRVLYEAMVKALPIVTTMVGGIPGRMVDRFNCIAIQTKSADSIVRAIENLAYDLALLNSIGRNGQKTVLEILSTYRRHVDLVVEGINSLNH